MVKRLRHIMAYLQLTVMFAAAMAVPSPRFHYHRRSLN